MSSYDQDAAILNVRGGDLRLSLSFGKVLYAFTRDAHNRAFPK